MREYTIEVWQNGKMIASATGYDFLEVHAEAMMYAMENIGDGPVEFHGIPPDKMQELIKKYGGQMVQ